MPIKKINRLIIIGNGFDLAHNLKTCYNDFIVWYLKYCFSNAFEDKKKTYEDPLIKIVVVDSNALKYLHRGGIIDIPSFVDHYYEKGFDLIMGRSHLKFDGWQNNFSNPFSILLKSEFIIKLVLGCSCSNWVDIENAYYEELKDILSNENIRDKEQKVLALNNALKWIITQLSNYLCTIECNNFIEGYNDIISADIKRNDFADIAIYKRLKLEVGETLILNFNYTSTIEKYITKSAIENKININYIHGKLNDDKNKLIFGFGDELDTEYSSFEISMVKGIFEHIKSFWYFKTSNYHNLIRFIDSDDYQVYILGHSCGLSDRTMLNMILEHDNCKSIKIFYYEKGEYNNYTELTQEISRHFKDKQKMRKRIVPFDKSSPMPQVDLQ